MMDEVLAGVAIGVLIVSLMRIAASLEVLSDLAVRAAEVDKGSREVAVSGAGIC